MFSPEASLQSARSSLRGTRRRQRDSNGHDQPRRKRSKIAEDGASQITAGSDLKTNGSATMNGHAGHDSTENSLVLVDMPVREKKAPPKRTLKEDSAQYLVGGLICNPGGSQLIEIDQERKLQRPKIAQFPVVSHTHLIHSFSAICRRSCARVHYRPRPLMGLQQCDRPHKSRYPSTTFQPATVRPSPSLRDCTECPYKRLWRRRDCALERQNHLLGKH